ncbi:MAG: IS110 family transposase [Pseudonocardiales bacterium]|nr:IS110 family transposase [Pseudonocardiales bacterium]
MIIIGIDPHKSSLTAVAVDSTAQPVATIRVAVTTTTVVQLQQWAARWPQRRWAVEGAEGLGRGVAQGLASAGEQVVDVPAQIAARARLLNSGHARKTDALDAASVAAVAMHHPRLRVVRAEDHSVGLRLLSDRRDDLSEERTRTANRLPALLRDLVAGGAKRNLSATQAAGLLRTVRPMTAADAHRKSLAQDLLADLRRLDRALVANAAQIQAAVVASGTTLTTMQGIGPVLAAKILGHTSDIRRFPTRHHYASYCGTAPIEASSGEHRRHRLSRAGNRQLNRALHLMAVCQIRTSGQGKDYYLQKLAETKTAAEARRALKRRLSDAVYRRITKDQQGSPADT